jgi:undecaprenyl-diphosphatase
MSIIEAILLGIIQGATEFLPISSSGHLVLLPSIIQFTPPDLALIGLVHLGTLLAVLVYFRRDLWGIITAVIHGLIHRQPFATTEARLGWLIVLGSIPAAVVGLLFEDFFDEVFGQPTWAAFFLLVTSALLVIGERMLSGKKEFAAITWRDTLIIGAFQAFALFPGVSRSGSTIVGGLLCGLDRSAAARFSFLLGVPVILAAGLFSLVDIVTAPVMAFSPAVYLTSFAAAAVTGYLCIYFLLSWLRNHSLYIFAVYTALLGGGYLLFSLT